ncbi:MAG: type IV pilus assembly protein PilM [bacterium]
MTWSPFKNSVKRFTGIDIGTSSIKIVELSSDGGRVRLENYGETSMKSLYRDPLRNKEQRAIVLSSYDLASAIKDIYQNAQIATKEAIFSIPDFSSFFTSFKLPPMTKEEIPMAVRFEARQHIPLPLSEVVLDWSIIGDAGLDQAKDEIKILMVAVPHEVINQYEEVGKLAELKVNALEAEVFGLARSVAQGITETIGIIDMGAQTTTMSIVDNGQLRESHSFDISGNELTRVLSKTLNVNYEEAERMKRRHGVRSSEMNLAKTLMPLIDIIASETDKVIHDYYQLEVKEINKIIIAGGSALLPGLKEYLSDRLKKEIEIANPFKNINYPSVLEPAIKDIGPSYAVVTGVALRGLL